MVEHLRQPHIPEVPTDHSKLSLGLEASVSRDGNSGKNDQDEDYNHDFNEGKSRPVVQSTPEVFPISLRPCNAAP
jgi:hypothetical protein